MCSKKLFFTSWLAKVQVSEKAQVQEKFWQKFPYKNSQIGGKETSNSRKVWTPFGK